ncbi:MAG: hypothetical protein ABEJ70_04665 [Halobacteriaceae archaeon]
MARTGDVRVLAVMDLVLSFAFSLILVSALNLAGVSEFTWTNVGVATVTFAVLTYVVVLRG